MSAGEAAPVLTVRGACKSFGPVRALRGVDLELRAGEIVALLGDNGAGKSTLVKAICGVHRFDEGELLVDGEPVAIRSPAAARRLGIEAVYQDLAVFDNLTAADNFFLGRERARPRWLGPLAFVQGRRMAREWAEHADELQVVMRSHGQALGLMSGGQRQAVAVARAVAFATRIVILDEPTAALGVREAAQVLRLVRRLPARGIAVVLISHNLEHVAQVADRAVVLRQGVKVGEAVPTPDNHERIVAMIVGAAGASGATGIDHG